MKTSRLLLAAALIASASACSTDVTAPELSQPASASANTGDASSTTTPTATPTDPDPEPDPKGDGGLLGSGGGK